LRNFSVDFVFVAKETNPLKVENKRREKKVEEIEESFK